MTNQIPPSYTNLLNLRFCDRYRLNFETLKVFDGSKNFFCGPVKEIIPTAPLNKQLCAKNPQTLPQTGKIKGQFDFIQNILKFAQEAKINIQRSENDKICHHVEKIMAAEK